MLPVIALVGRPNVGKSTLFNRLTRSRDALVANYPGLTRDRQYGLGKIGDRPYMVVDTGGLSGDDAGLDGLMLEQSMAAVEEADLILFLVDGRDGLTGADDTIARELRRTGKPVVLVMNKADGIDIDAALSDFHSLGLGEIYYITATHGRGVKSMMNEVLEQLPQVELGDEDEDQEAPGIRIGIIGRPNVGKSTLVNRLLGEDRVVVFDMPGTTRDSVFIPMERDGEQYTLIDTAGVRRRARIKETVEKFSIVKTLEAIERSHVTIMVLDAREGITDQDAHLLGTIVERGRALVIAINKWDGLQQEAKEKVRRELDVKLPFLDFARIHFISALHGSGVGDLYGSIHEAYDAAFRKLVTNDLTRTLEDAVSTHQPPLVKGRRIKLRYAHQGGQNPPIIVIHGNQTDKLPEAYRRYLINLFRKQYRLIGTPIRLEFKSAANPYEGKRNQLSERQVKRRRRMMKFVKKKK